MRLSLSNTLVQRLSIQTKTAQAIDDLLYCAHDVTEYYKNDFTSRAFFKEATRLLLSASKKAFFNKNFSGENTLRYNKEVLERALKIMIDVHKEEVRDSKYSHLAHVLGVELVLARLGFSKDVVFAGGLHDSVESTQGLSNKIDVLNRIYREVSLLSASYVFSVSAPDIQDAVEKDRVLYKKAEFFKLATNDISPSIIKCFDSVPVNIYDLEFMKPKDGRSSIDRQLRFLKTSEDKATKSAKEIDEKRLIPIGSEKNFFSAYKYVRDKISEKRKQITSLY